VTCYPEGVIWNALVDAWGLLLWAAEMHARHKAPGSKYSRDLSSCPNLEEMRAFGKERQAAKRRAVRACALGQAGGAVGSTAPSRPRDSERQGSETVFVGVGRRVMPTSSNLDEIVLATGFSLFTSAKANERHEWPPVETMKGAHHASSVVHGRALGHRASCSGPATCR
jgi:hypothetical protein